MEITEESQPLGDIFTMDWQSLLLAAPLPIPPATPISSELNAQIQQEVNELFEEDPARAIAATIVTRPHHDEPLSLSDVLNEEQIIGNVQLQRELLAKVPPPLSSETSAPQLGAVAAGQAPPRKTGMNPLALAETSSVQSMGDIFAAAALGRQRLNVEVFVQNSLLSQRTAQTGVIDDQELFNWILTHLRPDNSFQAWSHRTLPNDKYAQLAVWVMLNTSDIEAKTVAVKAAQQLHMRDFSAAHLRDPPLCRVIKNDKAREMVDGLVNLLMPVTRGEAPNPAAIDKFVRENQLERSHTDRMKLLLPAGQAIPPGLAGKGQRHTPVEQKGMAALEWLAAHATGNVTDEPGAASIRQEAARRFGLYKAKFGGHINISLEQFIPKVSAGTEADIIRQAYKAVHDPISGSRGYLNPTMRATVRKVAEGIEQQLLPEKLKLLSMYVLEESRYPGKYEQLILSIKADIETYQDALRKYNEIYAADIPTLQGQLRALYVRAKDLESTGGDAAELTQLLTVDIPNLQDQLRTAISGTSKGFYVIDRRLSAKTTAELYVSRQAKFLEYAQKHAQDAWGAHPMFCPFKPAARALLAQLADIDLRIARFNAVVKYLRTTVIPKMRQVSAGEYAQRMEDACAISSAFSAQALFDAIRSSNEAMFIDVEWVLQDVRTSMVTGADLLEAATAILAALPAMGHTPGGSDPNKKNFATPMANFAGAHIAALLAAYRQATQPHPSLFVAPEPRQAGLELGDAEFLESMRNVSQPVDFSFLAKPAPAVPEESMAEAPQQLEPMAAPAPSIAAAVAVSSETIEDVLLASEPGVVEIGADAIEGHLPLNRATYSIILTNEQHSKIGTCPPLAAHPSPPIGTMTTRLSVAPNVAPSDRLMSALGEALALHPNDGEILGRAYISIVVPMLNLLREYGRMVPDYTNGTEHVIKGISSIVRFTAPNAPQFPSFPFIELDRFFSHFRNLSKQFPMRLAAASLSTADFKCPAPCSGYAGIIPDTMGLTLAAAFVPVWFNVFEDHGWQAPMDSLVTPFWSPMPDVMNARPPNYSVPDNFVMPSALSVHKAGKSGGQASITTAEEQSASATSNTSWKCEAYSNRMFLVPGGRVAPHACAYRVGRFVAKCTCPNDMFYAWQAEMGTFEVISSAPVFIPRQHVCLVFSHSSSAARMQFNCRSQLPGHGAPNNGPHLQNFCGVILVRCCVPVSCPTSDYENGPWYCGVFGTFDGTLKSFLEGPDMEVHDIAGNSEENLRGEMLKYCANGIVPYDMRFKASHNFSADEYWSRMVTYLHVMKDVLGAVVTALNLTPNAMLGLCPENFVYDTKGLSLANVANSLYLKAVGDPMRPTPFFRTSGYDIAVARRFQRREFYNFKMLTIGSACLPTYPSTAETQQDSKKRCLALDIGNVHGNYPYWHASDPFLPHNIINMASPALTEAILSEHARALTCEQAIILARYVFFKMGLCDPDSYMFAAGLQSNFRTVVTHCAPMLGHSFELLAGYAYDHHDMGIIFAQEPDIPTISGFPAFVLPGFIKSMLTGRDSTPASSAIADHLERILRSLSANTEINDCGSDPTNIPSIFTAGNALNQDMFDRLTQLKILIDYVVQALNSSAPNTTAALSNQIDATPLK